MRKLLISLTFAVSTLSGCELYYEEPQVSVDAQVPQSRAPIDEVPLGEMGEQEFATRPPQNACQTAGIACVAGWCEMEDPSAPLGCKCVRCGPACGNGIFEPPSEGCDDGNLIDGDGCSSLCQLE